MKRWENPLTCRYYEARICVDLFGRWEILRTWERIGSAMGMSQRDQLVDEQACAPALEAIAKRRHQRGYALVSSR